MANNPDRAELNLKLAEKHNIKEPCEVFGRGYEAEVKECKACKVDSKEYATACSELTKGTYSTGKKGGKVESNGGDITLESNSEKKDSKTLTTKGSKKMSATKTKKKIVKKKVQKAEKKDAKFSGWREGSSADIIHQAVLAAKKGLTASEVCKKTKGKFETTNLAGRVRTVLTAAVKLDLLKRDDDGVYFKK